MAAARVVTARHAPLPAASLQRRLRACDLPVAHRAVPCGCRVASGTAAVRCPADPQHAGMLLEATGGKAKGAGSGALHIAVAGADCCLGALWAHQAALRP